MCAILWSIFFISMRNPSSKFIRISIWNGIVRSTRYLSSNQIRSIIRSIVEVLVLYAVSTWLIYGFRVRPGRNVLPIATNFVYSAILRLKMLKYWSDLIILFVFEMSGNNNTKTVESREIDYKCRSCQDEGWQSTLSMSGWVILSSTYVLCHVKWKES